MTEMSGHFSSNDLKPGDKVFILDKLGYFRGVEVGKTYVLDSYEGRPIINNGMGSYFNGYNLRYRKVNQVLKGVARFLKDKGF